MSTLGDAIKYAKELMLIKEKLDELTGRNERLTSIVADHEGRLIRIETTLEIAQRPPSRLILPGN